MYLKFWRCHPTVVMPSILQTLCKTHSGDLAVVYYCAALMSQGRYRRFHWPEQYILGQCVCVIRCQFISHRRGRSCCVSRTATAAAVACRRCYSSWDSMSKCTATKSGCYFERQQVVSRLQSLIIFQKGNETLRNVSYFRLCMHNFRKSRGKENGAEAWISFDFL